MGFLNRNWRHMLSSQLKD